MAEAFIPALHFPINFNEKIYHDDGIFYSLLSLIHRFSIYEGILLLLWYRRCTQRLYYNGCRIHSGNCIFPINCDVSSIHRFSIYERILYLLQLRRCIQRLYYKGCSIHSGNAFFQLFAMWKVQTLYTTSVP